MSTGGRIFAGIGVSILALVIMMWASADQAGRDGRQIPPTASAPMRYQVMKALAGAGSINATEVQRRLQLMLDARKKGEYVDLIKLREGVIEAVREANALDDIQNLAEGLDELPPEYEKIVYPNGRPGARKAGVPVPELESAPPPTTPLGAARRAFFDTPVRATLWAAVDGWTKLQAPTNEAFALDVSGTLRSYYHETTDQRRNTGPRGFPLDVLNIQPSTGIGSGLGAGLRSRSKVLDPPDPKQLVFSGANWGALLGRFCSDDACDPPFSFDKNPWLLCIPKGKWFESRINIFRDSQSNIWAFDSEGHFVLKPVMIAASACEGRS